jgi:uroporphyrin-III C-methyltransferase/precorrin-2 dehydrogenase/sirohydrochlorin ferrochelatase
LDYFPLNFKLKNKTCLIVGGGSIAHRKAVLLSKTGANINVVSPKILPDLLSLVKESNGKYFNRKFDKNDILNHFLVIAATNDYSINKEVWKAARSNKILINVVDTPELCDFIFPAIIDRDPLVASISSSGSSPVLARKIRSNIESTLPSNFGQLSKYISLKRESVKKFYKNDEQKIRLFWEFFIESDLAERVLNNGTNVDDVSFANLLSEYSKNSINCGEVYIVGAGPGDPDLLTFKALRLIQRADVVIYDRLVSKNIVEMSRRDADKI